MSITAERPITGAAGQDVEVINLPQLEAAPAAQPQEHKETQDRPAAEAARSTGALAVEAAKLPDSWQHVQLYVARPDGNGGEAAKLVDTYIARGAFQYRGLLEAGKAHGLNVSWGRSVTVQGYDQKYGDKLGVVTRGDAFISSEEASQALRNSLGPKADPEIVANTYFSATETYSSACWDQVTL